MKIAAILLAGGVGTRMGTKEPKQFLVLNDAPLVSYSLKAFNNVDILQTIVIVAQEQYHTRFSSKKPLKFATPGTRRQDSVYQGLLQIDDSYDYVIVHDTARPFITSELILKLINETQGADAACLGLPIKYTVKESTVDTFVKKTLDRSLLWEIQTPQIVKRAVLMKGFEIAYQTQLTVTDDVSLAELQGCSVKLVFGNEHNFKITTPEDFNYAEYLIKSKRCVTN